VEERDRSERDAKCSIDVIVKDEIDMEKEMEEKVNICLL